MCDETVRDRLRTRKACWTSGLLRPSGTARPGAGVEFAGIHQAQATRRVLEALARLN